MEITPIHVEANSEHLNRLSLERYETLLNTVNGIVWEADAETFTFTFVSNRVHAILGYTPDEWLNEPGFWQNHIYEPDRETAIRYCQTHTLQMHDHELEYRMVCADGRLVWIRDVVIVVPENDKPRWLRGIMMDVTETKLLTELEHLEKTVLELNARPGTTDYEVLDYYVRGIEALFPTIQCSVLRVVDGFIYSWVAPTLPVAYTSALNGMSIGANAGSCGAAASLQQLVIASDIATDSRWEPYKHLALPHGLRACWSYPIIDSRGGVMATFAIYHQHIATPTTGQVAIVKRSAAILKIILENRQYTRIIGETNTLMLQGQELANLGSWQWNIATNEVRCSEVLYRILGISDTTRKLFFSDYISLLHTDDQARIAQMIQTLLANGQDAVYDERVRLADGTVRYLRSWARVIADGNNVPEKVIGACLDVTMLRQARKKMEEIAWKQSHIIRAPLARLMGLVYVLLEAPCTPEERDEMLRHIGNSAHELDMVIRDISDTTKL
jgi:PAS domain S-box-containing protein